MVQCLLVTLKEEPTIGIRDVVRMDEMQAFFKNAYGRLYETIGREGLETTDMPYARYFGMPAETIDVEAGVPVSESYGGASDVLGGTLPATEAVEALHVGSYESLPDTYAEIAQWMGDRGLTPSPDMWEFYLSDPEVEPDPAQWKTKVVWPVI